MRWTRLDITLVMLFLAAGSLYCSAKKGLADVKQVGILYEIWHCEAANTYAKIKESGFEQLTTELIIQSNGQKNLSDVYPFQTDNHDIYNVQPKLGFYCLCSPRSESETHMPNCPMVSEVAKAHAKMLYNGGFDYIAVDITNWPTVGSNSTDVSIVRPLENLFEEWLSLRSQGINTPDIVLWVDSPVVNYNPKQSMMWQYLLDHFYNNATRAELIWRQPDTTANRNLAGEKAINNGKLTFFLVGASKYNATVDSMIRYNEGRNNIETVKVWALFGKSDYMAGEWGFFSPCTTSTGSLTTSMIGTGSDCNQYSSSARKGDNNSKIVEISASGGYMLTQCALPFASPGHMRGLTMQRLFKKILRDSPPNVFMSSFNEHIGGRQQSVYQSNVAYNMGLPNDPQKRIVWVDTYGAEFSRDIEPTIEGGSRVWEVTVECIRMYKNGLTCGDEPESSCCTTGDKLVWHNAFSLKNSKTGDNLVTNSMREKNELIDGNHSWHEVCHSIAGPSVFCVNSSIMDGRNGPFMLYSLGNATKSGTRPVYRCIRHKDGKHYLSNDAKCGKSGKMEYLLGYTSNVRGLETLRELFRCDLGEEGYSHALDLSCGTAGSSHSLGFVR